jgi:2-phosphosulfolactate phosphatase
MAINVNVVLLPSHLRPGELAGRACAVFDVLRATTTMAAALAAGVKEIRLFDSLDAARAAAASVAPPRLLCGESQCLPPAGFDLGNSPGDFGSAVRGATILMCTTNGTRALLAARSAAALFTAALVNANATAAALAATGRDITLLCAGTGGEVAMEDVIGAGALVNALQSHGAVGCGDAARIALQLFQASRESLGHVLRE